LRVEKHQKIAGQPAVLVRDFLKSVGDRMVNYHYIMHYFKVKRGVARTLIDSLTREGLLIQDIEDRTSSWYKTTNKGLALSLASAARPLIRSTAEKKLCAFLVRVLVVNTNEDYLYKVSRVVLFGSYLSKKERINDIDIALELVPKNHGKDFNETADRRIKALEQEGRVFRSFEDELFWPSTEAWRFLKSRSWALSLHHIATMPKVARQHTLFANGKVFWPKAEQFEEVD
jgi:predicted nucleotidyltransferase/predicted transcriptional regulator